MLTREGVPYTYDSNGNTLSKRNGSGTTSYAWDFENRLTSVTLPTGSLVTFKYDPFGRRINKTFPAGSTTYVYDGDNIIEELTGSTGTLSERYTYGPGVDEPLVGQRQPLIFYYEADGLGSVTSLTTPTGTVAATYTYDSFGFMTNSTGSATNWFRYTARQFDSDTALYYYRARYYDPTTGRFLSEDPIGFKGSGTNFYAYAHNSPVNLIDPSGLCANKSDTADCIQAALHSLFPAATSTVGDATKEIGGHWNFNVNLQFSSYQDAYNFYSTISNSSAGFQPPARLGNGPALHLENTSQTWTYSNGTYMTSGTAHIDIANPNNIPLGTAVHTFWDGLVGHLSDLLGGNIDLRIVLGRSRFSRLETTGAGNMTSLGRYLAGSVLIWFGPFVLRPNSHSPRDQWKKWFSAPKAKCHHITDLRKGRKDTG